MQNRWPYFGSLLFDTQCTTRKLKRQYFYVLTHNNIVILYTTLQEISFVGSFQFALLVIPLGQNSNLHTRQFRHKKVHVCSIPSVAGYYYWLEGLYKKHMSYWCIKLVCLRLLVVLLSEPAGLLSGLEVS